MASASPATDLRNPPPPANTARTGDRLEAARTHGRHPERTSCRRRFDRVRLGFWLGALILGTAGCLLGARMPCRHPVGVASSVLWWGIYLGALGASVGALAGLVTNRAPAFPPHESAGAGTPPYEAVSASPAPAPRGTPGRQGGGIRGFDSVPSEAVEPSRVEA
jgi:hypothetical protein